MGQRSIIELLLLLIRQNEYQKVSGVAVNTNFWHFLFFLLAGETDTVICYSCNGRLFNWEDDDEPWTEHARWYPRCAYVRQRKGDQFVASVRNKGILSVSSEI